MTRFTPAIAVVACLAAGAASAQPRDPVSPYVIDVRGATVGLPTAEGWTPGVPSGAVVPARGLGFDISGHVLFVRSRVVSLGGGMAFVHGRGTGAPPEVSDGTPRPAVVIPDVTTRMTVLAPFVSLNFGHRMGWSYLSAGPLTATVVSEATIGGQSPIRGGPEDRSRGFHFGGGARWFLNDRVGVTFDLRWHQLSSRGPAGAFPGARRQRMLVAGAGLSVR
ncbi:MAG: hypothetical protein AB1635_10735 [Acidobacteriota bacterium]